MKPASLNWKNILELLYKLIYGVFVIGNVWINRHSQTYKTQLKQYNKLKHFHVESGITYKDTLHVND